MVVCLPSSSHLLEESACCHFFLTTLFPIDRSIARFTFAWDERKRERVDLIALRSKDDDDDEDEEEHGVF